MSKKKRSRLPNDVFLLAPGTAPEAIARALAVPTVLPVIPAGQDRPPGVWCLQSRRPDKGRTRGIVYLYRPDGSRVSTKISVDAPNWEDLVQIAGHALIAVARDAVLTRIVPEHIAVCDLLSEFVDAATARAKRGQIKTATLENYRKCARRLATFLGDATLAEIDASTVDRYFAWVHDRGSAFNIAVDDLGILRRGVNEALKRRKAPPWIDYDLPSRQPAPKNPYSPPELDRLLAAALGYRFVDADTLLTETDPETGEEVRALRPPEVQARRQPIFRAILLGSVSGSRKQAICELSWLNNAGPWIDVDEGVLHRQGEFQKASKNKRRGVCLLPEPLLEILRPMRDADLDAGVVWALHDAAGDRVRTIDVDEWAAIHEDACVPYRVFHALKDTAIQRARIAGVRLYDAAEYFQTTPRTLLAHYGADWDLGLQIPVAEAIGNTEKWRAAHAANAQRAQRAERARAQRADADALGAASQARVTACGATVVPIPPPRAGGADARAIVAAAMANLGQTLRGRRIEGRRAKSRGRQTRPWPLGRGMRRR